MMILVFLFLAVLILAYSNGANDNFKGVATLWGSGTLGYRTALILATCTTLAGSLCSYFFAETLIRNFSGKGLVPDEIIQSMPFAFSVALGAGTTVLLATRFGFPVSTTHSLVGALAGAGLVAVGAAVNGGKLGKTFFLPLLLSPLVSVILSGVLYWVLHHARKVSGIQEADCMCIGKKWVPVPVTGTGQFTALPVATASIASTQECRKQYMGNFFGIGFHPLLNAMHYVSGGMVSFARGLNDTPKLVSLLLITKLSGIPVYISIIALVMAVGGLLNARKVADRMSNRIARFNHGQGLTANLVTGVLVLSASGLGLPVSTTHVSVGSIYGIGLVNKTASNKEISKILLSWLMTLPIAATLSALFYFISQTLIN